MDIFVFHNPSGPTLMQNGEIINGMTNKLWVERYAEAGEFRFVAPVSSGIKDKLPIGSFISHIDTDEIMIVENHEINDNQDQDSTIIVTGRSFETILEQRISGSNREIPLVRDISTSSPKFHIPAATVWQQIVYLIDYHINQNILFDINNAIFNVTVDTGIGEIGIEVDRKVEIKDIYSLVTELLPFANLGIKNVRPGVWSPLAGGVNSQNVEMRIHKGIDRTASVTFSYDTGQLVSADYLWSNKNLKNSAMVISTWMQTQVNLGPVNLARRMMYVSALDIDENMEYSIAVLSNVAITNAMIKRGTSALMAQKDLVLTKVEASKHEDETKYRVHYNVGDLVSVVGSYNATAPMRVTSFVEIEDENGTVAYPTLSLETE